MQADGKSVTPRPFLRWAGSKQRLIPQLLPHIPKEFGRYFEPFLGSGALYFHLNPSRATLSDFSSELIGTWRAVRDHIGKLCEYLDPLKPDRELFYRIRSRRAAVYPERAAEFLYLNKTCWNGLYRVNSKGEFNVPYGAPVTDFIYDKQNLETCSKILNEKGISLRNVDFQEALRTARSGDFVFLDPPYVTKHNNNGFRDWNERLFSWSDQERLAQVAHRLADKGVYVIVSNGDHDEVAELYRDFRREAMLRPSTLASDASKRCKVTEALFIAR